MIHSLWGQFIDTVLFDADFLTSWLRVRGIQGPRHRLAGMICVGGTLWGNAECAMGDEPRQDALLTAEMPQRTGCHQEVLMNICTICTKLRKNSFTFFSSSSSHSLHPDSVTFCQIKRKDEIGKSDLFLSWEQPHHVNHMVRSGDMKTWEN